MTISKTPRADLKRIVDPHARALIEGQQARTSVKWDFTEQPTDIPPPPAPWQESAWRGDFEPLERETWRDVWADVRGVVLCAAFVLTVLAFGAHVAGLWGK